MKLLWSRRWFVPATSLALGLGVGAGLSSGGRRQWPGGPLELGLLARLPVVPVVVGAASASLPPPAPLDSPRGGGGGGGGRELAKYGLPGLAQLRSRESYVLCYDARARSALWVVEQLNAASLSGPAERGACDFAEDDSVHQYHRATNADYRASGFDRGHLAAAANHKASPKAMADTFYLSNVAPQVGRQAGRQQQGRIAIAGPPGILSGIIWGAPLQLDGARPPRYGRHY